LFSDLGSASHKSKQVIRDDNEYSWVEFFDIYILFIINDVKSLDIYKLFISFRYIYYLLLFINQQKIK